MAISATAARSISLFCVAFLTISAIIVLGITAWAVQSDKSVTVIYTLVIACLTVFFVFTLLGLSFFSYRKPIFHVISSILEFILAFLFFTLVAAIFSFITVYALAEESHGRDMTRKEKPATAHPEAEVNPETQVNNGHVNNGHVDNGLPPNNVV
ncbi:hypothetical protein DPV78_003103 [Talaromyces pinophilus]|nr:hypothetical protein DPV78_003103 [Talaromyces pinophilus]